MVNVPPLLCSTPPPIDFGDDDDSGLQSTPNLDDEFSDYGLNPSDNIDKVQLPSTACELELPTTDYYEQPPHLIDDYTTRISPPPLQQNTDETMKTCKHVEAFNFQVSFESQKLPSASSQLCNEHIELNDDQSNDENEAGDDGEEEVTSNDNVPSLKLDSLSLYSSEEVSSATLSPSIVIDVEENFEQMLEMQSNHMKNDQVQLEDILDDSSDEYSPKKRKSLIVNENSDDFFGIHVIGESVSTHQTELINENEKPDLNVQNDPLDFNKIHSSECPTNMVTSNISNDANEFPAFQTFENAGESINDSPTINSTMFDIFTPLQDDNVATKTSETTISSPHALCENALGNIEDDFDDFQDFVVSTENQDFEAKYETLPSDKYISQTIDSPTELVQQDEAKKDSDDFNDDDFGDFNEATLAPEPSASISKINNEAKINGTPTTTFAIPPPAATTILNVNDKVKPILEIMFPQMNLDLIEATQNSNDHQLQFPAIELSKALDYQWNNSDMRLSLIKSLGIDSRNILFGEKWNSSMPRFAANLSFDPLKPMKPVTNTNQTNSLTNTIKAASDCKTAGNGYASTKEQPSVEFDWKNSTSKSPIDGFDEKSQAQESETIYKSQSCKFDATNDWQKSHANACVTDNISADCVTGEPTTIIHSDDATTATPANVTTTTASTLSTIVPTDSNGHSFNSDEQQYQQHIDLRQIVDEAADIIVDDDEVTNNQQQIVHEVVTTSTYAGPLKETHIYTPSKVESNVTKSTTITATMTKTPSIDFDYEMAAAGIIIDETVVKKEYRDVEYNPKFGLENEINQNTTSTNPPFNILTTNATYSYELKPDDISDDDFSDFQSVSAVSTVAPATFGATRAADKLAASTGSRISTPTFGDQMILSPAILLPQAISMDGQKPKRPTIEWGDSAVTNINPEELARIEALFPEPKAVAKPKNADAKNSTPLRQQTAPNLSISAGVAAQKYENDDDDWSEFVSVPVAIQHQQPYRTPNNNCNYNNQKLPSTSSTPAQANTNDDNEWSDFVSGATTTYPQFNSAAWKNANFYNNPLSLYQQNQLTNLVPNTAATHSLPKHQNKNFNNNFNQYRNNHTNHQLHQQQQQNPVHPTPQPQHIHIMHDFSTVPIEQQQQRRANNISNRHAHQQQLSSQFQIGNAKVAPRISLIPDMSFTAPALPSRTGFINALPKPSFSAKK